MRVSRSVSFLSKIRRIILWWNFHQIFIWKCVNDMCRHCSFVEWYTRAVCVCCAWCSMGLRSAHILCTLFLHQIFGHGAFFPLLLADAAAVCQHACGFGWNHLFGKNWFISWDSYECHEIVSTTKTIRHNRTEKTTGITFSLSSQLTFPHFVRIVASVFVCNIALSQPYPLFLSIESPIRSLCAVQATVFFYLLRPTLSIQLHGQKQPHFKCSQTKIFA